MQTLFIAKKEKPNSFKVIILMLFLQILYISTPLKAQHNRFIDSQEIFITDIFGNKEKIQSYDFREYSDNHKNLPSSFFEIILNLSPRHSVWVHDSQIKIAAFKEVGNDIRISVTLDNGENLSGLFLDNAMFISGKGILGEVRYPIKKVSSIEFLSFYDFLGSGGNLIDRKKASLQWKEREKVIDTWAIFDGQTMTTAKNIQIRDSYNTNKNGLMVWYGKEFRVNEFSGYIEIQRGVSNVSVPLNNLNLESIEITGRKIDDKPEVVIIKRDKTTFIGPMLLKKISYYERSPEYGLPDEDDMLIWNTPYGHEGISLLPLRKITIKAGSSSKE